MFLERTSVIIFLALIFPQIIDGFIRPVPEVTTSLGVIRGVRARNGNYSMYMGIPYAKVNASNPFGKSLPYPHFESTFIADDGSIACPQIEEFNQTYYGSLDCLTVNIYVPDSASYRSPLPVIVYIFGGEYKLGLETDFLLGPKYLVRHDVIFVTINYRLNLYGFMCLHTSEVPGNQGLRDQYEGMKWVKKHISEFGGDSNKITLMGSSSGATSIDIHVLSELEPLYNGIIIQSGSSFLQRLNGYDPYTPLLVAKTLGLNTTDVNKAVSFLSNIHPSTLVKAIKQANLSFKPCIEKKIDGVTNIITTDANNKKAPKAKKLKILVGSTDDEMRFVYSGGFVKPSQFVFEINKWFGKIFNFSPEVSKVATDIIKHFYVGDKDLTWDAVDEMGNFFSDNEFIYPLQRTIKNYLDSGAEEIYYYFFTYVGNRNFHQVKSKYPKDRQRGAVHADELSYLFDMKFISDMVKMTPEDQLIVDRMTLMWTNFAKYGNPTPNITKLLPVKWQPITQERVYHYINITSDINVGKRPFHQRMTFWDLFFNTYGQFEKNLEVDHDKDIQKSEDKLSTNLYINQEFQNRSINNVAPTISASVNYLMIIVSVSFASMIVFTF